MSIKADVDRGIEIRKLMIELKAELEGIDARLETAGLEGEQKELEDPEREGRQYLAKGTSAVVPVIFTADLLRGEFQRGSVAHHSISAAGCGEMGQFYKPFSGFANVFKNGKKFRAHATEILGEHAPAFITACVARDKQGIAKSAVKVDWDRALKGAA